MADQVLGEVQEPVEGSRAFALGGASSLEPEVDPAQRALEAAAAELDAEARRFWRRFVATIVAMTLASGALAWLATCRLGPIAAVWSLFLGFPAMVLASALAQYRTGGRRSHAIPDSVRTLAEGHDVSTLPSLVGAYHIDSPQVRRLIVDGLIDLLPRVKASDRDVISAAHQARLCGILRRRVENPLYKDVLAVFRPAKSKPVALRVAILKALEQIGDGSALPVVRSLAEGPGRSEGEKAIRDAARECLPALQQRAEQEKAHGTLLRPAQPPSGAGDTLLRPAGGAPGADAEVLLRAVYAEQ